MTSEIPKRYTMQEIFSWATEHEGLHVSNMMKQVFNDLHEAKKTLLWYANTGNYNRVGAPTSCRVTGDDGFGLDWGKRAMKTLEEIA